MCNCNEKKFAELMERVTKLEKQVNGVHEVVVPVEVEEGASLPVYARKGDAGMDLIASQDVFIPYGEGKIISTGIKVAVPDGFEVQVRARSGISAKTTLIVANSPGTVDSGFRGVVGVILFNNASYDTKSVKDIKNNVVPVDVADPDSFVGGYTIKKGDRIAQIVLNKVCTIVWEQVDDINVIESDRGDKGFGSTGVN